MGHYKTHLQVWFDVFGRNGVQIILYDDLATDPVGVVRRVTTGFGIEVDEAVIPGSTVNSRDRLRKRFGGTDEGADVGSSSISRLQELYKEDVHYVAEVTGRDDLSWLP